VIGTIEALGVFLLAVLPGFVGIRLYGLGRPPLRVRGVLQEIATTLSCSLAGWATLYLWRGRELLPAVLAAGVPVAYRIDAFAELVALAVTIGVALAIIARSGAVTLRLYVTRGGPSSLLAQSEQRGLWGALRDRVGRRWQHELRNSSVPGAAWDRLLARLNNGRDTVLCRVKTSDGQEVFGVFADGGYADWGADGRDLLLMPEVVRDAEGNLQALQASRGVFVAGDRISSLSVVRLPDGALPLADDG
jgi:hypothetical protein